MRSSVFFGGLRRVASSEALTSGILEIRGTEELFTSPACRLTVTVHEVILQHVTLNSQTGDRTVTVLQRLDTLIRARRPPRNSSLASRLICGVLQEGWQVHCPWRMPYSNPVPPGRYPFSSGVSTALRIKT